MDVRLLKLLMRDRNGVRCWIVPGHDNVAKIVAARLSIFKVMSVHWPAVDPRDGSPLVHGARLDWYGALVKQEIKKLISECRKNKRRKKVAND